MVNAMDNHGCTIGSYYIASTGTLTDYIIQLKVVNDGKKCPYTGDFLYRKTDGSYGDVVTRDGGFDKIKRLATSEEIKIFNKAFNKLLENENNKPTRNTRS